MHLCFLEIPTTIFAFRDSSKFNRRPARPARLVQYSADQGANLDRIPPTQTQHGKVWAPLQLAAVWVRLDEWRCNPHLSTTCLSEGRSQSIDISALVGGRDGRLSGKEKGPTQDDYVQLGITFRVVLDTWGKEISMERIGKFVTIWVIHIWPVDGDSESRTDTFEKAEEWVPTFISRLDSRNTCRDRLS